MRSLIRDNQLNQDVYDEAVAQSVNAVIALIQPVTLTGDQTIGGIKTFLVPPLISGGAVVVTTGNQTIGGRKTFNQGIEAISGLFKNGLTIFSPINGEFIIYNTLNDNFIDWQNGTLGNDPNVTINWANLQLTGGNWQVMSPVGPLDITNKSYVDNDATNIVRNTGNQTILGVKTFSNQAIFNSGLQAQNILITGSRVSYFLIPENNIDLNTCTLNSAGSVGNLNWTLRILSGNWLTNTIPTSSGHIINKGYLDGNPTFNSGLVILGPNNNQSFLTIGNPGTFYNFSRSFSNGGLMIQGSQVGFNNICLAPMSGGNVGIGTGAPTANLHVTGSVRFSNFGAGTVLFDSSGNISSSSDERLKNINGYFNEGTGIISLINPIKYHWNKESNLDQNAENIGFSAQEISSVLPQAVGQDSNGFLSLGDRPILAALCNSIKELLEENKNLKSRLDKLES